MEEVIVFGHKSPDTDTICSAIVMADLQTKIRGKKVTPCRLGEINEETFKSRYKDFKEYK